MRPLLLPRSPPNSPWRKNLLRRSRHLLLLKSSPLRKKQLRLPKPTHSLKKLLPRKPL